MKSLRESLLDDDLIDRTDKLIKDEIKAFLKENYKCVSKISKTLNADGKYEVSSNKDVEVKNENITSLTNGMFIWTTVNGSFMVRHCPSLTSLEGAPEKVEKDFDCISCKSLKTLKGAPKEVGGYFNCSFCHSLESLEGAPEKVEKDFDCHGCDYLISLEGAPKEVGETFNCCGCLSLTSLKYAPKEVGGCFYCSQCKNLTSLEGAPKEVGRDFSCRLCKVKFTENDVKKVSNVKRIIIC